ncbi:OmpA family protein [Rhodoblastus sp.]|uniref:OmpA family protein n=1 Tax=Rhodoblastus sp. TaxID=1962975 RepID=UPI0035B2A454
MGRPGMGWIGLASACALWLALIHFETPAFEAGLAARAGAVLRERLGETASAQASGRDIRLDGRAFDESARADAREAIAALPGVRRVEDALGAPPPLAPFPWRAVWDGAVLTLSGGAPSPAGRAAVLNAARQAFAGARIVDDMVYASGAPPGFVERAAGAVRLLGRLRSGEAQAQDGRWRLSGQAATEADGEALRAIAEAGGPIAVEIAPSAPAPAFAAEHDGRTLRLSGAVGAEADHVALLASARQLFPDAAVVDNLRGGAGAPTHFGAEAAFALRALAQLQSGKVVLSDHAARLSGVARRGRDAASLSGALDAPPGATLDTRAVSAGESAPYLLEADKDERALVLTGSCGDDAICAQIRAAAAKRFPSLAVRDSMQPAPGAPKGFLAAALGGLEQLARLRVGHFTLRDSSAALRGDAVRAATAETVKTALIAAMPEGFSVQAAVTGAERDVAAPPVPPEPRAETPPSPPAAEDCKPRLAERARAATIQFDYASDALPAGAAAVLTDIAAAAVACPQAALEIAGHSDDAGSIANNFDWSWRRAEAVAAFLLAAGVPPQRLRTEGFGETAPVAPNDSDEHRARNRRIEIRVK